MAKNKLQKLLEVFEDADDKTSEGFKAFDAGVAKLKSQLKEKIQVNTLEEVNDKLDTFRKRIDLDPLMEAFEQIKAEIVSRDTEFKAALEQKLENLQGELSEARGKSKDTTALTEAEIATIKEQLEEVANRKFPEFPDFLTPIKEAESRLSLKLGDEVHSIRQSDQSKEIKKLLKDLEEELDKLRKELMNRINNIGTGNMNRQVLFNSTDYLRKYTDYNLIAGTNTTFTITEDNINRRVNLTISSSGSGGGGITRVITNTAISMAAGSAADTDYVILAAGTVTITLPTAVGNKNLYTVKNVGSGIVTIDTTGGETIDGDTTVTMPVQFTSVDLISNTMNWAIT